jgi:two-component system cell cycle response regulator DivK
MESICIIDRMGIISRMNNEFHYSTGLRMTDCVYDHIDKSVDTGDSFKNIELQNNRFDLFPIDQQMITSDGWVYILHVNSVMTKDYISLIIRDTTSLSQRLMINPVYRIKFHFDTAIKVLVIDDSIVMCKAMKRLIEQSRTHICDIETDSTTSLDANFQDYDLFVFDIHMPGYSGINLIEMIKGDRRLKSNAKFVAISSYTNTEFIEHCLEKGFDMFLPKPFNKRTVQYLIHAYKTITRP